MAGRAGFPAAVLALLAMTPPVSSWAAPVRGPESRQDAREEGALREPAEAKADAEMQPAPGEPTTLLDAWTRAWTPGKAHARLASRAGFWKLTTRTWGDPSEEPVVTETTAVREMVLGERVLREEVVGEVQGLEFQSLGYLGYDNVTRRWWSLWMDSLSTAPVFTTGTEDPEASVLELTGEYADPVTGATRPVRTVIRFVDYDTERFEWWETRDGEEVKTMDVLYQRQGPLVRPER